MGFAASVLKKVNDINESRGFVAVRQGFMMLVPLVLIGSFAVVITRLPIPAYQAFMAAVFSDQWTVFGTYLTQGTFSIMSIGVVLTVSYSYANLENPETAAKMTPSIAAIVGLMCLITLVYAENDALPFATVGVMGIFVSLVTALVSSALFMFLSRRPRLRLIMDNNAYDSTIGTVFAYLLPAAITVIAFAVLRSVLLFLGIDDINGAVNEDFVRMFFGATPSLESALAFMACMHFLWFFGFHGSNILEPVTQSVFAPVALGGMDAVVMGQAASQMFTKDFFDVFVLLGGSGATLCLLVALLTQRKRSNARNVSRFSIIPSLFNVNEPMIFGIPIVMNIYFFVPFILTPLIFTLTSFAAVSWGLVPFPTTSVEWTTPIFLSGYMATGSLSGSLLQGVNLVLGVFIYLPFVRLSEKNVVRKNKAAMNSLITCALERQSGLSKSLVGRNDAMGNLARILSVDLKNDLAEGTGLRLEYQPKVNYDGKVVGVEALLRWEHRIFGNLPAPLAVALAEDGEFIHSLGGWVFESACKQFAIWKNGGMRGVSLSVNISPSQMDPAVILPQFHRIVRETGADPGSMEIEITEQTAINQMGSAFEIIRAFKEMGFEIALDDFGMGHTSLIVLKEFQMDTIKLDGSLVQDIVDNVSSQDVVSSIMMLAEKSNFSVVAEYVETLQQRDMLHSLGCDIYQGWLYSKPLPPEEFFSYYKDAEGDRPSSPQGGLGLK